MIRTFPRATEPHHASLGQLLRPVIDGVILRYDRGLVYIDHPTFEGVTDAAIQAVVDAAPVHSASLDAKAEMDGLGKREIAIIMVLVDAINLERTQHGRPVITRATFIDAVKAKIDTL